MLRVVLGLLPFVLAIYALVDCIQTPDEKVRHIPKLGWIVLIVLIAIVGPVAWLIAGRQRGTGGRAVRSSPRQPIAPDDDPDFLNRLGDDARKRRQEKRKDDPRDPPEEDRPVA